MRKIGILVVLTVFFAGFLFSVARMEKLLADGTDALLPLAPVDPRALLLGDYMALEYVANADIASALRKEYGALSRRDAPPALFPDDPRPSSGTAVMRLVPPRDQGGRAPTPEAVFVRLDDGSPLAGDEVRLAFKARGRRIVTAAPAFYFQEGEGGAYERARYGRIRLDGSGTSLLVALCDGEGRDIRPSVKEKF